MPDYISTVESSYCTSVVKKKQKKNRPEISQGMGWQDIVGGLLVMNKYVQFKVQEKKKKGRDLLKCQLQRRIKKKPTHNKTVYIFLSKGIH